MIVGNPKTDQLEYFTKERLEKELPNIKWDETIAVDRDVE